MRKREYISFYRIVPDERMATYLRIGETLWRVIRPLDGSEPALDKLMIMSVCFSEQGAGVWAESSYYGRRIYIGPDNCGDGFFNTEEAARRELERLENDDWYD